MPGNSFVAFGEGVVSALNNDVTLQGLLTGTDRVFSNVPEDQGFPYIEVSESSAPYDSKSFKGQEYRVSVMAFFKTGDPADVRGALGRVYELLHDQEITVSGHNVVNSTMSGSEAPFKDPEGEVWQGAFMFRMVVI